MHFLSESVYGDEAFMLGNKSFLACAVFVHTFEKLRLK